MRYLKHFNPAGGLADFWAVFRQPNPYRWRILALSVLATYGLLYAITHESSFAPPKPPPVTYITTYAPGRSDAEIIASNIAHEKRRDAIEAQARKRAEARKDMYRALGRATGLDVDAMEAEIAARKARAKTAKESAAQAALPAGQQNGAVLEPVGE